MFKGLYQGRNVAVTGHTGFKGAWLSLWLSELGARVHGIALEPPTDPNLHEACGEGTFHRETHCDIGNLPELRRAISEAEPDFVFHLAGQPLTRHSYAEPLATFHTNTLGSVHLMEAVRSLGRPCTVVMVTSDKCYENIETNTPYGESDRLGGRDVYSASKAAAEIMIRAWRESLFKSGDLVRLASARAGNVIGGGDYAADRIVPDSVRALCRQVPISVRNPGATRPWQHVLECLSGYLWLGASLAAADDPKALGTAFNFGPEARQAWTVREVVEEMLRHWPGSWRDASDPRAPHEHSLLSLSISKAEESLAWRPAWSIPESIRQTTVWYRERHLAGREDMHAFSIGQISAYVQSARDAGISWACDSSRPTVS